ncbi:MAG: phosphatidylserine decarboxylase [Phycisphaerae bacterium]
MRIALTKYGLPQVVIIPAIIIAVMFIVLTAGLNWLTISVQAVLFILLVFVISFFRNPKRQIPQDNRLLLAPADGTIRDIELIEDHNFTGGKALRIGIFLSIFNAHINRSPCSAKVEKITYKKGKFKDARDPLAGKVNESNDIILIRNNFPEDKIIVRQISGAIARRIVCSLKHSQILASGEKFGMIKFGSRTELYVPARDDVKCLVNVGDKVKAGISALIRYE